VLGTFKTIILYFLSGIGGCLFSCMVSNANGVGASVSIYGLLGAYVKKILNYFNFF
jgi:membrane associated rhomboid family serine protease